MDRLISYKTADGQLHEHKVAALQHDYMLSVRGLIQSKVGHSVQQQTLTPTQVANIFKDNMEEVFKITSKFRDSIRRNTAPAASPAMAPAAKKR